jgi:hypothetical protein
MDLYGSPDEIFGPIVNAYHESIPVWYYHAKGVWIKSNSVRRYVVDRRAVKSTPPGSSPQDSTVTDHARFRDQYIVRIFQKP